MSFDRRRYQREYARKRHEAEIAQRSRGVGTCQRRFGRFEVCGSVLETIVLRGGTTRTSCPRCERFKAGICRDCPARVAGRVRKARRCAACTEEAHHESIVKYRTNNRRLVNRRAKLAARANWKRNADYKRLWRLAYPEKVAAQKRRYYLRQPQTAYEYQHERRKTHHPHFEESRFCVGGCGFTMYGRAKKCEACKESLRVSALRMLQRRAA